MQMQTQMISISISQSVFSFLALSIYNLMSSTSIGHIFKSKFEIPEFQNPQNPKYRPKPLRNIGRIFWNPENRKSLKRFLHTPGVFSLDFLTCSPEPITKIVHFFRRSIKNPVRKNPLNATVQYFLLNSRFACLIWVLVKYVQGKIPKWRFLKVFIILRFFLLVFGLSRDTDDILDRSLIFFWKLYIPV